MHGGGEARLQVSTRLAQPLQALAAQRVALEPEVGRDELFEAGGRRAQRRKHRVAHRGEPEGLVEGRGAPLELGRAFKVLEAGVIAQPKLGLGLELGLGLDLGLGLGLGLGLALEVL